jgi:hypothetical protein
MSNFLSTNEDFKFFDFLSKFIWPRYTKDKLNILRKEVKHGNLHIETLLENALAKKSKGQYKRIAEWYRDFCDNSDAKKSISQFRNNNIAKDRWTNSFFITGLAKKTGLIRAVCYSKEQDKFYFFAIPYVAYKGRSMIEIVLDASTGYKEPTGIPKGKWVRCQVESFNRLATITEGEAEKIWAKALC